MSHLLHSPRLGSSVPVVKSSQTTYNSDLPLNAHVRRLVRVRFATCSCSEKHIPYSSTGDAGGVDYLVRIDSTDGMRGGSFSLPHPIPFFSSRIGERKDGRVTR